MNFVLVEAFAQLDFGIRPKFFYFILEVRRESKTNPIFVLHSSSFSFDFDRKLEKAKGNL